MIKKYQALNTEALHWERRHDELVRQEERSLERINNLESQLHEELLARQETTKALERLLFDQELLEMMNENMEDSQIDLYNLE